MLHQRINKGFTLVELLVAMTVFLIVVGITSGVFVQTIRTQRTVVSLSESMNNVTLALEQIARGVRTGYNFTVDASEETLSFITPTGDRVYYHLGTNGTVERYVFGVENATPITSEKINITDLRFKKGAITGATLITIATTVKGDKDIEISLQTSVSSRILGME